MHPVRITNSAGLERNRWTVGFRLILAIPHLIWISLWSLGVFLLAIAQWFITLFAGAPNASLHRFMCLYVRYAVHLGAYLRLAADPYPGFVGERGSYPVDVELPDPGPQNRWRTGLRLPLAVPAGLISTALGAGFSFSNVSARGGGASFQAQSAGAAGLASFLGWWACLFTGRMPRGLRNVGLYSISYAAQFTAYVLLITDVYPDSDPLAVPAIAERHEHPVTVSVAGAADAARSRLTTAFRLLLALPHVIWLLLWAIVVELGVVANWFVTLVTGSPAEPLHRLTHAFLRYQTRVYAYLMLLTDVFPRFDASGSYPLELSLPDLARQNRWKTGFRLVLVLPAYALAAVLALALYLAAFLGWWAILVTGRMPRGLRNLGVYALRYLLQTTAYLFLITDVYPYAGPAVEGGGAGAGDPQGARDDLAAALGLAPERPLGA